MPAFMPPFQLASPIRFHSQISLLRRLSHFTPHCFRLSSFRFRLAIAIISVDVSFLFYACFLHFG